MEPVFTKTLQIGIVVRALEAAMRAYVEDFGMPEGDLRLRSRGVVD